jgi:hypothetical protein
MALRQLVSAVLMTIITIPVAVCAAEGKKQLLYEIEQGGKSGFIDHSGKIVVPPKYETVRGRFQEGFVRVELEGNWGFVGATGKELPIKYDSVDDFEEGRARVKSKKNGWGFIDRSGTEVIPPSFEDAGDFHQGLAKVMKGDKWGYVDLKGKQIVAPTFKEAADFHEGLAQVRGDNKLWGYVDRSGKLVIGLRFKDADDFKDGLAKVKTEAGRDAYINPKGVIVWEQQK